MTQMVSVLSLNVASAQHQEISIPFLPVPQDRASAVPPTSQVLESFFTFFSNATKFLSSQIPHLVALRTMWWISNYELRNSKV